MQEKLMSEEEVIEETPKAYAAFMDYCLLGTSRSLEKLRQKLGRNTAYIRVLEQWSSRYQWVKRVTAYDKEQLEDRRHKAQEAVDAMNTEIAEEAKKLRALAVGHLEYIEHMHGKDAVALWKEAVLAQRLALGEATT